MNRSRALLTGMAVLISVVGMWSGAAFPMELPESMHFSQDGTQLLQGGTASSGLYDETVLRTIHLEFKQEDWWQQLEANYGTGVDLPADLTMDGVTYSDVGVRFRGTTSYMMTRNSKKKSFNISIDYGDPEQRLMGYRTLNLNNGHSDPSFMREVLYFGMCREYTPSPKASFVKLVINGENWGIYDSAQQNNADLIEEWFLSNDGERWKADIGDVGGGGMFPVGGVPVDPGGGFQPMSFEAWSASPAARDLDGDGEITEQDYRIFLEQPGAGQIPGGTPPDSAAAPGGRQPGVPGWQPRGWPMPGGGGGGMFRGGDRALTWLGGDVAEYEQAYELKTDNTDDPWSPLIAACDVLNNTALEQLADTLDAVLAVDRWLWFLAVENVFTDEDSYLTKGADYEIYYEVETGQIHPLQHDGNEAFNARSLRRSPVEGENNENRPVISRLLAVPELRQRYLARVRTIVEESLDWDVLAPKIEAYRALIGDEVRADAKKLYSNEEFEGSPATFGNFVRQRREFLLSHPEVGRPAPEILAVSYVPSAAKPLQKAPLAGETVRVTAEIGGPVGIGEALLYYAEGVVGPFDRVSMFDDGAYGDGAPGDGIFTGEIPPFPTGTLVRYYIEARASDEAGTAAFAPVGAEHDVFVYTVFLPLADSTPVVINELMAGNDAAVQDPQGEYDDWIELLNVTDQEVDLSGMYLTDQDVELRKWAFPEGTTLGPGAYLVVWADGDDGDAPGLHTNFRLSTDGEMVLLVDSDGGGNAILDAVTFGEQEADVSFGRYPEGIGLFAMLSPPTPGAANRPPTAVSEEKTESRPKRFSLAQNFPNPFNSSTTIAFSLSEGAEIEMGIYNLLGQKLVTLVDDARPAGEYRVQWDGRDEEGYALATGVYLYCLRAGEYVETRQLMLLR